VRASAAILGRPVQAVPIPRERWPAVLAGFGCSPSAVAAWIEMDEGFKDGWMSFECGPDVETRRGQVELEDALRPKVANAGAAY